MVHNTKFRIVIHLKKTKHSTILLVLHFKMSNRFYFCMQERSS